VLVNNFQSTSRYPLRLPPDFLRTTFSKDGLTNHRVSLNPPRKKRFRLPALQGVRSGGACVPSSARVSCIMCDESGHTEFPFSYLEHVKLLTLAQARFGPCSGVAQAGSPLLTLITIFGRLRRSLPNHFNSDRRGQN